MEKKSRLVKLTGRMVIAICLFFLQPTQAQKSLYGMTYLGGTDDKGVIFKTDGSDNGLTLAHSFESDVSGKNPDRTQLIQAADGKLYGVTTNGGANGLGVLFQYNPVDNIYVKKLDFDGAAKGANPYGSLLNAADGKLYGTTNVGGANNKGVLFQFDSASNVYSKKLDFDGAFKGDYPWGSLMQTADGKLYGMTAHGGANGLGVLFQYDPASSVYTKKLDFDGTAKGAKPLGVLLQVADGKLYGLTYQGGTNNSGVLFQYDPATNAFIKKLDFVGTTNGANPLGSLIQATDGKLYGLTYLGGANNKGVLFQFDAVTNVYTKKLDFDGAANGTSPTGSLMQAADGKLYGTTIQGGLADYGVLFQFDAIASTYDKKLDFNYTFKKGSNPDGSLLQATDGKLYGMTSGGGSSGYGVVFSYDPSTGTYAKVKDFNNSDGATPRGSLIQATNGKLYGMTNTGGNSGNGVVFSYDPSTGTYVKIKDFNDSDGSRPFGSLVQATNGKLYGMTNQGGTSGSGVVFSYDPSTGTFVKLKDFNDSDGAYPFGSLIQAANGKLYGMTLRRGIGDYGVIFSYDPSTGIYSKLKDFNNTDGAFPFGSLVQASNGKLYGMTNSGGSSGYGVIFSYDPSTGMYAKLKDYSNSDGADPQGSLVQAANGKLYGMTSQGGSADYGVAFSYDPVTNLYNKLNDFNGTNGGNPAYGALIEYGQVSPIILVSSLNSASFCSGAALTVPYNVTGTYNSDNVFTAQLSDASGSFANPVNIGNVTGTASGSINATIPLNTVTGPGYRIRVVSSNPVVTGGDNGSNLSINSIVTPYIEIRTNNTTVCTGDDVFFYAYLLDNPGTDPMFVWRINGDIVEIGPAGFSTNNLTDGDVVSCDLTSSAACAIPATVSSNELIMTVNPKTTYYKDTDGDSYGNPLISTQTCTHPTGYVTNNTDCDDADNTKHSSFSFYADADGDGRGAGTAVSVCAVDASTPPSGYSLYDGDCDDSNGNKYIMFGIYTDGDGDGYGAGDVVLFCAGPNTPIPSGYSSNDSDCDDTKAAVHPGANEICNSIDDNCDGQIDEGCNSLPMLNINDITVYESDGQAVLTVSLSKKSNVAVNVSYTTKDGSAVTTGKNKDYVKTIGSLSIPAGSLTASVQIPVIQDNILEGPEIFQVSLSKPKNATILDGTGTVTIQNGNSTVTAKMESNMLSTEFSAVVYPNPSKNSFNLVVKSGYSDPVTVSVFDMAGRLIYTTEGKAGNNYLFGETFPVGVYIVDVRQGDERVLKRVIKNE